MVYSCCRLCLCQCGRVVLSRMVRQIIPKYFQTFSSHKTLVCGLPSVNLMAGYCFKAIRYLALVVFIRSKRLIVYIFSLGEVKEDAGVRDTHFLSEILEKITFKMLNCLIWSLDARWALSSSKIE